jgi:threonine/homoserine/homoserine lactone efflux protein
LLQLAVGPVCFYIFDTSSKKGFISAELGVVAVVIIDAIFILLAIFGITAFLKNDKMVRVIKIFGFTILCYFGVKTILSSLGFISSETGIESFAFENSFIGGLLLTVSNPLTILFWAGVFSSRIAQEKIKQKELYLFGTGAVLSTFIFLSCIGLLGKVLAHFLPLAIINMLNMLVGVVFLFFAVKLLMKRTVDL